MDKNQNATCSGKKAAAEGAFAKGKCTEKTADEKPDTLKLIRMSEIATEAIKWIWYAEHVPKVKGSYAKGNRYIGHI